MQYTTKQAFTVETEGKPMVTAVKSLYAGFNLCFVLSSHLNPIEHFTKDLKMAM